MRVVSAVVPAPLVLLHLASGEPVDPAHCLWSGHCESEVQIGEQ